MFANFLTTFEEFGEIVVKIIFIARVVKFSLNGHQFCYGTGYKFCYKVEIGKNFKKKPWLAFSIGSTHHGDVDEVVDVNFPSK